MKNAEQDLLLLIEQLHNGLYKGIDLSVRFSDEIASFGSPWAWIQERIKLQSYRGLLVGDYIPFSTADGEFFEAQIAGINTYSGTSDSEPGINPHIDFITRDCMTSPIPWNLKQTNNGTAECESPWLSSHLYRVLNTTIYDSLPEDLKAAISPKRMMLEKRYSPTGQLCSSNGWQWSEAGMLWIPNEYEVYGSVCWGTKGFSSPQGVQYPLFRNSWKSRMKGAGMNGERTYWWLLNPFDGDAFRICLVAIHGNTSRNTCVHANVRIPLCFRICG